MLALVAFGLVMLFSASYAVAMYRRGTPYAYIRPQLLFAAVGLAAMYVASRVDYHIYHKLAWPVLGVSLVLLVVAAGLAVIVFGVMQFGWGVLDIASIFLCMGIVGGIVGGTGPNQMARDFIAGAKDIAMGAIIVGIARGILVVMSDGQILDTIVHALASVISGLPKAVAAEGMLVVQCVINFFIPSGSGQASTTMPIMTPLADIIGLTRQTAVLAFHFGDGFTNAIIPTHGTLCASLGIAGIPFNKWFKFALPVVAVELVICAVFMVIATAINYGPF